MTVERREELGASGLPVIAEIYRAPSVKEAIRVHHRLLRFVGVPAMLAPFEVVRSDDTVIARTLRMHSLADELARGPLDEVRLRDIAHHILLALAALDTLRLVHGNLCADAIVFPVSLGGEPVPAYPAFQPARHVQSGLRVRDALAVALFGDEDRSHELKLSRLPAPEPGSRRNPFEQQLVEQLALAPGDINHRSVYADWLEQRGDLARAMYLRHDTGAGDMAILREVALSNDADWRKIVGRAPVRGCWELDDRCPQRWDLLEPTDDPRCRTCTQCSKRIFYAKTREVALGAASFRWPVALDPAIDDKDYQAVHRERQGAVNPPPPETYFD